MAEIIDIRERLKKATQPSQQAASAVALRVRICGPDPHWMGVVGGILTGALALQGCPAHFLHLEGIPFASPVIDLLAGKPQAAPGLVVSGSELPPVARRGCNEQSLLLAHRQEGQAPPTFPGRMVLLPLSVMQQEPLFIAAACAAGAARLLGIIGWDALEKALRQELNLIDPLEAYLIVAFETYHQLALLAGTVSVTAAENS